MAQTQPESKAWKNMWRSPIRVRGFNGFAEPAALELSRKTWRISKGQRGGRRGLLPQPLKKAHVLANPNMPNKINQYVDPVWWLCNMSSVHGIHAKTIPKKLVIFIFTMHSTSNQLCRPRRWSLGVACLHYFRESVFGRVCYMPGARVPLRLQKQHNKTTSKGMASVAAANSTVCDTFSPAWQLPSSTPVVVFLSFAQILSWIDAFIIPLQFHPPVFLKSYRT